MVSTSVLGLPSATPPVGDDSVTLTVLLEVESLCVLISGTVNVLLLPSPVPHARVPLVAV